MGDLLVNRADLTKREKKWEGMRHTLEARRLRILDEKNPVITAHKEDLDQQCAENAERRRREKEEQVAHNKLLRKCDNQHKYLCEVDRKDKLFDGFKLEEFRRNEQSREKGQNYDLYNKDLLKQEKPINHLDPDIQGASALVNMIGFKLMDPSLEVEKRKIQKQYLDLQTAENKAIRERNEAIRKLEEEREVVLGDKAEDDHKKAEQIRSTENIYTDRINAQAIEYKAQQRAMRRNDVTKFNKDEIDWWWDTRMMTNEPDKHDVTRRINFRGVPAAKIRETFDVDVRRQCEELAKKRQDAVDEDIRERRRQKDSERLAKCVDLNGLRQKTTYERDVADVNKLLAKEHKDQENYLARKVYGVNQPDDYFWRYFGATGR